MEMETETVLCDPDLVERRGERKFLLSKHAQERAAKRMIRMHEINAALQHASKEPADNGAWKYTFGGVSVIIGKDQTVVLTVYPEPGYGINIEPRHITREMMEQHLRDKHKLRDLSTWTSHTVAIVDQSGSMRAVDVDKNVTRSDLVWLNLAVTVVAEQLHSGNRCATDVLSLVTMKDDAETLFIAEPFDWILFNRLLYLMKSQKPERSGNYLPALDHAESLLSMNRNRNCALGLLFFSDGRPSDEMPRGKGRGMAPSLFSAIFVHSEVVKDRIAKLSSICGKRLAIWCLAIGPEHQESDDFSVLKSMADTAAKFECQSFFRPASLESHSLTSALRSLTTSMTSTMTTLAETTHHNEYEVKDFVKMPKDEVGRSDWVNETWEVVPFGSLYEGYATIIKTCWGNNGWITCSNVLQDRHANGLALETRWFGEGKERLAKELREVTIDTGRLVGPKLVAKTSILKRDGHDEHDFHKRFLKTQSKSQQLAELFNQALENIPGIPIDSIPRIEFLPCWVNTINTITYNDYYFSYHQDGAVFTRSFLVEPMLDTQKFSYEKYNDNQGGLGCCHETVTTVTKPGGAGLRTIFEGADGEKEKDNPEAELDHAEPTQEERISYLPSLQAQVITSDVPQAFSCFTYWKTKRRLLVCDLQGILNTDLQPPRYQLTDPAIHSDSETSKERYGRTDRRLEGILDFLKTHKCSQLCFLLRQRHYKSTSNWVGRPPEPGLY